MKFRLELAVVALVAILDQFTKLLVVAEIELYQTIPVVPGLLNLTHIRNSGVAFGLFNAAEFAYKPLVMTLVALTALVGVGLYASQLPTAHKWARAGLALILGAPPATSSTARVRATWWTSWTCTGRAGISGPSTSPMRPSASASACSSSTCSDRSPKCGRSSRSHVFPELFSLGPVTVYTYGVVLAAAYLLGLQLAMRRARARGMDPNRALDLGIAIIVSALVGAKLLLVIVDFDHFRRNPGELFSIVRAGGVFYGGLIAAILVAFWYMQRHKMPLWMTTDIFAPGISLGHAVGRLGCLAAGCCYGHPTNLPWAITFTNPAAAANVGTPLGVPLHPTQLYESGTELVILAFLLLTEKKGRPFPGRTFWAYLLLYGLSRFVIEFFRGDPRGMVFGNISTSQFISLILVPISLVMLVYLSRKSEVRA